MKYRYLITSEVEAWIKKQNFGPIVIARINAYKKAKEELSNATSLMANVLMNRIKIASRPTLIWFRECRKDITIYVLRRVYTFDTYSSKLTIATKQDWVENHPISEIERLEIESFAYSIENAKEDDKKKILEPMTEEEATFISSPLEINAELFEFSIYETEEWIKDILNEQFQDYANAAQNIRVFIYENLVNEDGWYQIQVKGNVIVIYKKHEDWVLLNIVSSEQEIDLTPWINLGEPIGYKRGYPYSFLWDWDDWRLMELDKKSNLVLSQKQIDVVSNPNHDYPLFITGRAGSGKSTMLQYLFAEIILRYYYLRKNSLMPPVYLSYNDNLIKEAKKLTRTLFEKNQVYRDKLEELNLKFEDQIEPNLDKLFFVFEKLVKSCIKKHNPDILIVDFHDSKHLSFALFKNLWNKKFGQIRDAAKKYGPSVSWHVIRTYIKGWDSSKIYTPDDYYKLPEGRRSVTQETFEYVYEKVWKSWYSTLDNYWDDQDLVRYCLENNYADEQFSAVFCDEAQDFTRIELDFILKLSSFSNRKIDSIADINKMPFVFAGDEFQTLNPTGFSWESLKEYFEKQLCAMTGLSENAGECKIPDTIPFLENFRSTQEVVKLANRVQLIRASRFKEYSEPQSPHFPKKGDPILCLPPTNLVIEQLKKNEVVLIVPVADGESIESFIKKTALNGLITFDKGTPQDIIILNPTQAKGLEYPDVAIFGFDCKNTNANLSLTALTKWYEKSQNDSNNDTDIDLKYEISNAYVALTRASDHLYIIDDFEDLDSFWAFAFIHDKPEKKELIENLQKRMIEKLSPEKQRNWSDKLGGIIGVADASVISSENIGYLRSVEHINDLEERASVLMDAVLMRQAACRHREAGRKKDEERCWAKSYIYVDEYQSAAEHFKNAEMFDDAAFYYWAALNQSLENPIEYPMDQEILTSIARLNGFSDHLRVKISIRCRQKTSLRDLNVTLDDVYNLLRDENELLYYKVWQFVVNILVKKVQPLKTENKKILNAILDTCNKLRNEYGVAVDSLELAKLAYRSDALDVAIKIWELIDKSFRPVEYYNAKIKTLDYPYKIEYFEGTKDSNWPQKVLDEYVSHLTTALSDTQKSVILKANNLNPRFVINAYESNAFDIAFAIWEMMDIELRPKEYYFAKIKTESYPNKIEFYEGTKEANWYKEVLTEYKKHPNSNLSDTQKEVVLKAIKLNRSADKEYVQLIPYMLRKAQTMAQCEAVLNQASSWGIKNINKDVILAISNSQVGNLSEWRRPTTIYTDTRASQLFDAIEKVQWIQSPNFLDYIDRFLVQSKLPMKEFAKNFSGFQRLAITPLIFSEIGKIFEQRNVYMDAIRFYENARLFSDNPIYRTEMECRWIVCKERMYEYSNDDSHMSDAFNKRRELNLLESKFPEIPLLSNELLDSIYSYALSIGNEVKKEVRNSKEQQRKKGKKGKTETQSILSQSDMSKDMEPETEPTQSPRTIVIDNYKLTIAPQKSEIAIQYEEDGQMPIFMKIKNGTIPSDGDFYLKKSRLYFSEDDKMTPLGIEIMDNIISIWQYSEGSKSEIATIKQK